MAFHFISGLPRAGSTLLASLFNQNPRAHASIISPMGPIVNNFLTANSPLEETHLMITPEKKLLLVESQFEAFYQEHLGNKEVILDNNRMWCAKMALLNAVFPGSKVICMVRPCDEIVESFEALFRADPTALSRVYRCDPNATIFERVNHIISPAGVVGYAWNSVQEAMFGPYRHNLVIVDYSWLVQDPVGMMNQLNEILGLPPFVYNPEKIKQIPGALEFDRALGTPGLHTLRSRVEHQPRTRTLPDRLQMSLAPPFWARPEFKEEATSQG